MKTGSSLQKLAAELERQQETKRDFLTPTRDLVMVDDTPQTAAQGDPTQYSIRINGHGKFGISDTAHDQLASRLGIPQKYYERMRDWAPSLLLNNVNHWFNKEPARRMVRTLDGKARAFLSDRYRPLDNLDMAQAVLPVLADLGVKVESAELTERRLYVQAVTANVEAEIRKGDVVRAGIVVSNSEIGLGSVKVEPMVFRLVCSNGLIASDRSLRKFHVGRAGGDGESAEEFYCDETRQADDRAFWMKVRDVVTGSFRRDAFDAMVAGMRASTGRIIDVDPIGVVEVVRKDWGMSDDERSGVLQHLIRGGDLTQYGLLNAVTRQAEDVKSYDRAIELERAGGEILDLDDRGWRRLLASSN